MGGMGVLFCFCIKKIFARTERERQTERQRERQRDRERTTALVSVRDNFGIWFSPSPQCVSLFLYSSG